ARRLLAITQLDGWSSLPEWFQTGFQAVRCESLEHGHDQEVLVEQDGRKGWRAIRYSRMTSPAGDTRRSDSSPSCLVAIVTDVTAQKSAEQEREKSRNAVALAEMATVLAHEIRNPLGSLELLSGCLANDPGLGDESKRCVQHLRAGVRSLSATVNNVLCFHNPGTQQMSPLDLGSVLKGSV